MDFVDSAANEHTRLWAHEVLRVFYDRIMDSADREWFLDMIKDVTQEQLKMNFNVLFAHLDQDGDGDIDSEELRRLFFGHYTTEGVDTYDELTDFDAVITELKTRVKKFEAWSARSSFVSVSLYQAEHITRLCRVLQFKRGHMLLVGCSGAGKRSMVRLATHMSQMEMMEFDPEKKLMEPLPPEEENIPEHPASDQQQPPASPTEYEPPADLWREYLREAILRVGAGEVERGVLLLRGPFMTDTMYEDLNCILNGIDIPGLFTHAEQVEIVTEMRINNVTGGDHGRNFNISEMFTAFTQIAYDRLHVCLCLDSHHDNLQQKVALFPCLITRTTVNYLQEWPGDTMRAIAVHILEGTKDTFLAGEVEKAEKAQQEAIEMGELEVQADLDDFFVDERHGLDEDMLPARTGKVRAKDAAERIKKMRQQIEKEEQIRTVCERMHSIAVEVEDEFMGTRGRTKEYICMTHYTYFLRCFRDMLLERRTEVQEEIDVLIPCIDEVRKVLNRKVEEERARKLYENEEEVLRLAGKDIDERMASVQEVVDTELVNVDQCKAAIRSKEGEIEGLNSQLEVEKMRLITIWNQATQALATMTARDVGKLKASLNVTSQTPDAVRLLVYACVALLDGTRAEDRVEKGQGKAEQDPLILCRPVIAGADFKKRLISLDRESPTIAAGAKIIKEHYATNPSFTMDLCLKQCAGSEKLFQWIAGVLIFFEKTREVVHPMLATIEEQKALLAEQNTVLDTHMNILKTENEKLDGLELEKQEHTKNVAEYAGRKGAWEKETVRASELVKMIKGDVANFWKEWNQRLKLLHERRDKLDEDCLLSAASISYLGCMRPPAREMCYKRWKLAMEDAGLWVTDGLSTVDFITGYPALPTVTNQWEAMGLPTDDFTLLNAVIITRGWCVPLIIDPHGFASNFVREHEISIGGELMELNADSQDIVGQIKYAVQEGVPVLLENVSGDLISGLLSHLLSRQTFIRRKRRYVHIGEDAVPYNENFRLYVTTRDEHPKLEQDVTMWVNVVDFDLTSEGLNLALRATLLREKAPDLFKYCNETLIAHIEAVKDLEAHDLKSYFHGSDRTVIKDDEVLASFSSALNNWMEIRKVVLEELRNYRVGIQRAELLDALTRPLVAQYECLWELRVLHESYQNVYGGFTNLILSDLGTEGRQEGVGDDEDEDINMMAMSDDLFADMRLGFGEGEEMVQLDEVAMKADLETLSYLVFQAVFFDLVRSIYERHHLVFTFAVAVKKMFASDSLPAEEWQHFLTNGQKRVPQGAEVRGTKKVEITDGSDMAQEGFGRHGKDAAVPSQQRRKPAFEWLSDGQWEAAQRLSPVRSLTHALREELCESIENNPGKWEPYFRAQSPVECEDPIGIRASLSPFQLLLLIRAFHPTHIMEGMRQVALKMYGVDAYRIPSVSIAAAHEDSTNASPLMFLLGPGSDPTRDIEAFADDMLFLDKLMVIESRESTVAVVDNVLSDCMEKGHWLLVRNIHTNTAMMRKLEKKCAELLTCDPHQDFRLWITSFPTGLSKEVYRQSMRIVWEAPTSLRGNLLQSFTTDPMTNQDFFYITKNTLIYKKCMFALCFLHAAVKERGVYGAFGWNNVPDVDAFDLKYCMVQMRDVIEGFASISVRSLRHFVSDLVYVGRITHKRDAMILEALSGRYFSDKLLNEGHTYTEDGVYYPPEGSEIEKYIAYVDNLPTSAPAALFGLPAAADHTRAEQQVDKTMSFLHDMQGFNVARKEGVPWQDPIVMTKKAAALLEMVPGLFNVDEVEKAYPLVRSENRNRVLLQELQLHNVLTRAVKNSLKRLMACMQGQERLDVATDKVAKDVFYGRVPDEWMKHSLPSQKPLMAFLRHLSASNTFFQKWVRAGIPSAFWLPAFFFPQAVASATTVNYCRHELVGIETVVLEHIVLDAEVPNVVRVPITDGAYVIGLNLVGAGWDRANRVLTHHEDMSLPAPFPALQLRPKQGKSQLQELFAGSRAQLEKRKQRGRRASVVEMAADLLSEGRQNYLCPIYRTGARADSTRSLTLAANNLVMEVDLPCALPGGQKNDHLTYVMRGTALIIQSDD
uniref:EF-hand domain-containing protein n=2 Tax=Hemiselmis andersenii TaxID=464988 RepID=A0A7S1HP28_HEMAN|mmetsp:Transcript_942/g.2269  ORF Transcript_942/g.2269 Transcript_942/m.2269 type:complete len:2066 (+) Transcript_942:1-6198(+)